MQQHARQRPSVSTRTAEFTPRELPLKFSSQRPTPLPMRKSRSSRIREALRRWFEQEM
jgi:hypothetical protein